MYQPRFQFAYVLAILLCQSGLASAQQPTPLSHTLSPQHTAELRLTPTPHFVVSGLELSREDGPTAQDYSKLFYVHTQSDQTQVPPLLGEYRVQAEGTLSFTPRYPLSASVIYCLQVGEALKANLAAASDGKSPLAEVCFQLPARPPAIPTRVSAIYPSVNELPENLLKFYIHFSAPMSRGQAYQRIQLYHDDALVEEPFLELGEELWDAQQQRFTLFIHPGRIKHGLRSFDEAGPALTAGQSYTLRIQDEWSDAAGFPLIQAYEKKFTALPNDSEQLNPEQWKIEPPAAASTAAVSLKFDEPLDHAMLGRVLNVKSRDGSRVAGSYEVVAGQREWQFTPAEPWQTGTYHIEVATILEDLCGNSLAKAFEVDLRNVNTTPVQAHIAIEFVVK